MPSFLDSLRPHAHWLIRLSLSSVSGFHGIGKLVNVAGFAEMMGIPVVVAWLVTFAEIAAAIGYIVGGFKSELITRLSSIALIPVLIGAIVMVHGPRWSFTPAEGFPIGGMEFQIVLTLAALYMLIVGNSLNGRTVS